MLATNYYIMSITKLQDFLKHFWETNFPNLSEVKDWSTLHNEVKLDHINLGKVYYWDILFLLILVAIVLFFLLRKPDRKHRIKVSYAISRMLLPSALVVWISGVFIYIVGFYNTSVAGLSVIFWAVLSSFKMFLVANDLTRVPAFLQNDSLYMFLFTFIHFAAALISFLFVFRMISYKIKSSFDIMLHRYFHAKDKVVHVFWGVNDASLLLAESIRSSYKTETIIFIDIDKDLEDDTKKKSNLNRILNTITITDDDIVRLGQIKAFIANCYNGPESLTKSNNINVFKMLGLNQIGAIVRKSKESHFYLLSEDESLNIKGALVFQSDICIGNKKYRDKITLHVHASNGANNEIFDHYSLYNQTDAKLKMEIVDSAYLSVMTLKSDERTHPVNCVDYDTVTGLVSSTFTSMVIGFGGTGQEAFKFLYEYATFIGPDHKKIPFMCYAVDEHMDKIDGLFRARIPDDIIGNEEIALIKASVDSSVFWDKLKELINDLNYLVITLNNDEVGLALAVNVFKYALQYRRSNKKPLKIALRSYSSNYSDRMREVCNVMNMANHDSNVELNVFGGAKEIFTCATIRQDKILNDAKQFHWAYNNYKDNAEIQWNNSFGLKKITELIDSGNSIYHAISEVNRKISQNISNSLHYKTKLILMGFESGSMTERLKLYNGYVMSRKPETLKYDQCSDADAALFENMATLEHERWISAHKLMGFRYAEKNDVVKKLNNCMCPFEKLDETLQSYDYNVVDTSIRLAFNIASENKSTR